MSRGLVVGVGVGVGSEAGVPGAKSAPSGAGGAASSRSAELGSGGRPSTLGGSCSSQEVPLRALSVKRRPCVHIEQHPPLPGILPRPTGLPVLGPWGRGGGGP